MNGSDTTFFLNRIIAACDTCSTPNLYLKNQPQFMQRQVLSSGGEYFFSDNYDFILKPLAQLNQKWEFDPTSHDTATVVEIFMGQLFGQSDSMKLITLTSGDSIIISKSYGLVQFPDFVSNQNYSLIGVEGPNVGELEPMFKDIFDFNVGDVFQYKWRNWPEYQADYQFMFTKVTISDKMVYPDSIVYQANVDKKTFTEDHYYHIFNVQYFHYASTIVFRDSTNHICNRYMKEAQNPVALSMCFTFEPDSIVFGRVGNATEYASEVCGFEMDMAKGIWTDFGAQNETSGVFNVVSSGPNFQPDLIEPTYINACADIFAKGLGKVYSQCNGLCNEFDALIGYIKNNDTTGTVHPDEYYILGFDENQKINPGVSIYPNPISDKATIALNNPNLQIEGYEMFNLSGQIVREEKAINANSFILEKGNIKRGCYILKVQDSAGTIQVSKLFF